MKNGTRRKLQSEFRGVVCVMRRDSKFDCVKLNPVSFWRSWRLETFVATGFVERGSVLISGYESVGCVPCARAVRVAVLKANAASR